MSSDDVVNLEDLKNIYRYATGERYEAPEEDCEFEVCTVNVEHDQPYENTSGFFSEYSEFFTWVGGIALVVSLGCGGLGSLGIIGESTVATVGTTTGVAGGVSTGAGVIGMFQEDEILTTNGGLTKFTVTREYYRYDMIRLNGSYTYGLTCYKTVVETYYYEPYSGRFYDGTKKKLLGTLGFG